MRTIVAPRLGAVLLTVTPAKALEEGEAILIHDLDIGDGDLNGIGPDVLPER